MYIRAIAISKDGTKIAIGSVGGLEILDSPLQLFIPNFFFQTWVLLEAKKRKKIFLARDAVRLILFYVLK